MAQAKDEAIRRFSTGATRDTDNGKLDPEGFFSPLVLLEYAEYMHRHRVQPDGDLRASDNWQNGMPRKQYMKSLWRHFMDLWLIHRGYPEKARGDIKEALCGIMFNAMGYMHEVLIDRDVPDLEDENGRLDHTR